VPHSEYEQSEPDYLPWGCFRPSFASASTPAGCLNVQVHGPEGLGPEDEALRGKDQRTRP
jgi:hypothetical protein